MLLTPLFGVPLGPELIVIVLMLAFLLLPVVVVIKVVQLFSNAADEHRVEELERRVEELERELEQH